VAEGSLVSFDDVEIVRDLDVLALRQEMERGGAPGQARAA
jgi:predicted homoserine dehydrogenase-like protein